MQYKGEEGQAVVIVALAMSIFLIGSVGLAVDGAHLYAQRQMAQAAADAAAQAGIMSIFDATNTASANPAAFNTGGSFVCGNPDPRTPCSYADMNGFSSTRDTVTVDFPPDSAAPGVAFSASDPTNLIRVTVQRTVPTTLMRMLGPTSSIIVATATAGIVDEVAPVPILVTHPTLPASFSMDGNPLITICGGGAKSIQVNSGDLASAQANGSATVDLSHAGPLDPGNCTTGTGASFGNWGGPSAPPFNYNFGSIGKYVQPASPIQDPLAGVAPPAVPSRAPDPTPLQANVSGCPASPRKGCMLYSPGLYPGGINGKLQTVVFKPGIYYIQNGGVNCNALCDMYMATGFTDTITGTGWTENMLIYNTGQGALDIGANGYVSLTGSPVNSQYLGILFFEDHNASAQTHSLGGGGAMTLQGTIYLTNTLPTMQAAPSHYQSLNFKGGSGSGTVLEGEIIVDALHMGGNGSITMDINTNSVPDVREVALVQ